MLVVVSYDVSTTTQEGRARLRKIAKKCQNYGIRVQNSVFECNVDSAQWCRLKNELEQIFDPAQDSLRYYYLGKKYHTKVEHLWAKPAVDVEAPLLL